MSSYDCIVAGGGLVGAAIAWGLVRARVRTALVDEGDVALRASRGNFGLVWVQGKGRGFPEYARWSRRASANWPRFADELHERTGIDPSYSRPGGVLLALGEDEMAHHVALLEELRGEAGNEGYQYDVLDRAGLASLLPGLGPRVVGGTYCPHDGHANPLRLLRALHAAFMAGGGSYFPERRVGRIETRAGGGFRVRGDGGTSWDGTLEAEKLVLAAGLGGRRLAPMVGLDLPVTPLQGQLMVTERVRPLFHLPTNLVRQTDDGTFLLGFSQQDVGLDTTTQPATLRDIAWRCTQAFPFLRRVRVVRAWAALRVMTPDGFPIYEQSESHPGAFAATCHSGVTLAANHALDVASWIAKGSIPAAHNCFRSARFHRVSPGLDPAHDPVSGSGRSHVPTAR